MNYCVQTFEDGICGVSEDTHSARSQTLRSLHPFWPDGICKENYPGTARPTDDLCVLMLHHIELGRPDFHITKRGTRWSNV